VADAVVSSDNWNMKRLQKNTSDREKSAKFLEDIRGNFVSPKDREKWKIQRKKIKSSFIISKSCEMACSTNIFVGRRNKMVILFL
jgi:hypothetical protein